MDLRGDLTGCFSGSCSFIMIRWWWFPQTLSPGFCVIEQRQYATHWPPDSLIQCIMRCLRVQCVHCLLLRQIVKFTFEGNKTKTEIHKFHPQPRDTSPPFPLLGPSSLISNEHANLVMTSRLCCPNPFDVPISVAPRDVT